MIGISAPLYDIDGFLVVKENRASTINTLTRRVSKAATLDGGSALADFGFSDSDANFQIVIRNITESQTDILKAMIKTYPTLRLSCSEGAFSGAIVNFSADTLPVKFTFLTKEKLS